MRTVVALLACSILLLSSVQLEAARVIFDGKDDQYIGIWGPWYTATLSEDAKDAFTVSIAVTSGEATFSKTELHFDPHTREVSFRINTKSEGTIYWDYALSGPGADDFEPPGSDQIYSQRRTIKIDIPFTQLVLNYPSEPVKLELSHPSTDTLNIIPISDDGAIKFLPDRVVIPAGSIAGSLRFLAVADYNNQSRVLWKIEGTEVDLYYDLNDLIISTVRQRGFTKPTFSDYPLVGLNSSVLYFHINDEVNNTVTVTPSAADTVFSPAQFEYQAGGPRTIPFTYVTQTIETAKPVHFYREGAGKDDYELIASSYIAVDKKYFSVQVPSVYALNKKTFLSIRIAAPAYQDVSVYLFAANLNFNPTNVTFSGSKLSAAVEVEPHSVGPDTISFLVEGSDKDWYYTPESKSAIVQGGQFIGPSGWYIPLLYVGVESPKLAVRVNIKPTTNVTLTPSAPDVIFTPATLTFTKDTLEQHFTITPVFTNTEASSGTVSESVVSFLVGGGDHWSFAAPGAFVIHVARRNIQFKWSAHVDTVGVKQLHLKKQYYVWATADYPPPTELTVTPTNPYMTFDPAVIHFSPKTSRVRFTAIVDAVVGNTVINYIIGGECGGLYTLADETVNTALRPLFVYQAVIMPDDRPYWGVLVGASSSALSENHVKSVTIRTDVIPDKKLTISPRAHHVEFEPASFDLSGEKLLRYVESIATTTGHLFNLPEYYVSANFSVSGLSSGVHDVWFELSGEDAPYYDVPDYVKLRFNGDIRPSTEYPPPSASARVEMGLAVLVFVVVMGLLL